RASEDPSHSRYFRFGSRSRSGDSGGVLSNLAETSERALHAVPGGETAEGAVRQTFGLLGDAARIPGRAVAGGVGTAAGLGGIEHLSVTLRELPTDFRENVDQILASEGYV